METSRTLGVLGGMGPLASAHFMMRLTQLTPATRDQEHIPAVLWSDPRVPDRTRGKLEGGADPLPFLLRGVRGLKAAGCGAIAIPCNTAHGWYEAMAAEGLPILHIVDAAADQMAQIGQRYVRGRNTGGIPGLGLGLDLVRTIATLHGGRLDLESVEGQGTTARLVLPCGGESGPSAVVDAKA